MKRNTKRLPALLLAILLCLNLLPGTVLAANATTVQVGGVELNTTTAYAVTENGTVTTENASNTNWNIKFEAGTLTLKGANITTPYSGDDGKTYGIYADGDLTLMLENASTVESSDTAFNYGVYINGSLTVSGSGSLTAGGSGENSYGVYVANTMTAESGSITGRNTSTDYYHYGDGIYVGNTLTVAGGTVIGSGKSKGSSDNGVGIRVFAGDLSVTSGSVEGTATGAYGDGIRVSAGDLTVSGGSVEGTAKDKLGHGIYVYEGDLTVRGSGSVEGTASGSSGFSPGIYVRKGNATVEGGSVTGTSTVTGNYMSPGIYLDSGDLTVSGGSVKGTASSKTGDGIRVEGALTVEGGSVTGTANGENGSGIFVNNLKVTAGSVEGTATGGSGYGICMNYGGITITGSPTVTATSQTAGNTVMIGDDYELLVDGKRYEPSANATVFKVEDGEVTGGETWALDVWVNGVKISASPDYTVNCGDGKAVYTPDTGTLTLTNAAISDGHAINVSGSSVACGIYAESDLNIELVGNSTVGTSGTAINIGVYVESDLIVSGSGTLTTETDMGICAEGAMTVESGTVISNSNNYGIFVDRLTVSGSGSVKGTAADSNSCGIRVDANLTVTGGSVTGTSTGSNSCGIVVADVLEVSGGSVTGEGAKYGVYVSGGVLEVSGSGTVSGTATGSSSDGIRVGFYLTANGGTVNGTGKRAGICLEQGALEAKGGTVTGEGADYGIDVAKKTLTVSGGSVSGTATGSEGDGIYVYSALTVSGSGDVTGTATGDGGWGINVDASGLTVNGGSVTGNGDSTGIFTGYGLTVNGGDVTGTANGDSGWGIDTALLNMTGGIVTGNGTEAAIVTYKQGDLTADDLISVPANYVPSGYQVKTVAVKNNSGVTYTYASFVKTGNELTYDKDSGFANAATEITLKAPGAVSFPRQFYASINFDPSYGYKSFGHVTKSGNEWMIYTEAGDVADRTIYGMESAGGAIFTVEGYKLAGGADVGWRELRVYSSDLTTSRSIGTVNAFSGRYWIVDTAMDLSGTEPVLYGTYQDYDENNDYYSYICKISLTDGTPSGELKVTGLTSASDIVYAIAFDEDGKLYAIGADAGDDGGPATLYTIDKASGTATKVDEIKDSSGEKISTNFTQDLAYDYHTGTLYWMENAKEVLYTVDAASAVATKVGQVRFAKDTSLKTYSLSAFCILDGVPATSGGKHMVSVIHDENVTVTDGNDNTTAAVYMLNSGDSLTLNITPDRKLGLWYVKVDGQKIEIEDPMAKITRTIQDDGSDHVIEVVSRIPINIEESKWNWDSYRGKTASYYTQHSVYKFYDLPDRFNPDSDTPDTGYTQTLLDENGQAIGDDERILVGNKYNVRVTHLGTEKYAPLNVTYEDVLNLKKCEEPPGRPVVYGKVGCTQGDLATTSYLQDYYKDDGSMVGTQIYDRIPVTLEWLEPEKKYTETGYFLADHPIIYAAQDLDERLTQCYNVESGDPLTPGCKIDTGIIRATQVVVLPADEASLIKLQASDASGGTVSGQGVYKNGTEVTVTATADTNAGYVFQGWQDEKGQTISNDATYTFTASVDRTLTAVFVSDPEYLVKLETDPTDGGTVTGGGNYKEEGHRATVSAEANEGYYFIGWYKAGQEEAVNTNTEHTFTVPEEGITLTARFGVDYLALAEQAKENFESAVNNNTLSWAILEQAVKAYKEAEDFVKNPPSGFTDATTRYAALTTYYNGIEKLDLSNQNLGSADLTKLDSFTSLTELNLSGTGLTDLSALNSLAATLKTLNLSNNKGVSDLSALKALLMLETLDISGTGVTKLDSLITEGKSSFPGCKSLTAKDLTLNSISALEKLVSAEDFNADSVTQWDFSGSTLTDSEENKADVKAIQDVLGDRFTPPTIKTTPTGGGGGGATTYAVTVEKAEHGKVTASPSRASSGTPVTITVTPDEGYELEKLTVTDSKGSEVKLTDKGNGKYTFDMPNTKVEIRAVFRKIAPVWENCPGGADCPAYSYRDVNTSAWYHEAVDYVLVNGLMSGYGNGVFGPNDHLSRAQLCQILYNKEGRPAVTGSSVFTDVAGTAWYADAVIWANANGIVGGYGGGVFGPDDPITREQLAAILWRYAGSPESSHSLDAFTDAGQISDWAMDAMRWANENGVLNGDGSGHLIPRGNATRAHVAQMIQNFLENIGA